MSGSRAFRRRAGRSTPPPAPPAHIIAAAQRQACPDCDSELALTRDRQGQWRVAIAHDDECVQLKWRTEHGALQSLMIAAEPGRSIPADLVVDAIDTLGKATHPDAIRVAFDGNSATSWQERQLVEEVLRQNGEAS